MTVIFIFIIYIVKQYFKKGESSYLNFHAFAKPGKSWSKEWKLFEKQGKCNE